MATIRTRIAKWQVQVGSKGSPPVGRSFTARRDAVEWARQMECLADRRGLGSDPRLLRLWTASFFVQKAIVRLHKSTASEVFCKR